jgi:hypothetical protein
MRFVIRNTPFFTASKRLRRTLPADQFKESPRSRLGKRGIIDVVIEFN